MEYPQTFTTVLTSTTVTNQEKAEHTGCVQTAPSSLKMYPQIHVISAGGRSMKLRKPESSSEQLKKICMVVLILALAYGLCKTYTLNKRTLAQQHEIADLAFQAKIQNDQMALIKSRAKTEGSRRSLQAILPTIDEEYLIEIQQDFSNLNVTCNGQDVCTTLDAIFQVQNQTTQQMLQLSESLSNLTAEVAVQGDQIAQLQNKTTPNVTDYKYLRDIDAEAYLFDVLIQLQDGRMAGAGLKVITGSYNILIWNITTADLSLFMAVTGGYTFNAMIQLQDGLVLASAVSSSGSNQLQLWNFTTGSRLATYGQLATVDNLIELANGTVGGLSSQGYLYFYNKAGTTLTNFKTLTVQESRNINGKWQLIQYYEGSAEKLLVVWNSTNIARIDCATLTIDMNIPVIGDGIKDRIASIYYSGNTTVTAIGDTSNNPLVVSLPDGAITAKFNYVAITAAMIQPGIMATTTDDSVLHLWNQTTGALLRNITIGVPYAGIFIVPLSGEVNGFAVGGNYDEPIAIFGL